MERTGFPALTAHGWSRGHRQWSGWTGLLLGRRYEMLTPTSNPLVHSHGTRSNRTGACYQRTRRISETGRLLSDGCPWVWPSTSPHSPACPDVRPGQRWGVGKPRTGLGTTISRIPAPITAQSRGRRATNPPPQDNPPPLPASSTLSRRVLNRRKRSTRCNVISRRRSWASYSGELGPNASLHGGIEAPGAQGPVLRLGALFAHTHTHALHTRPNAAGPISVPGV